MKKWLSISLIIYFSIQALCFSQVFPIEILKQSGSPEKVINLVILGDGYTLEQQDKFLEDASRNISEMFKLEPWKSKEMMFNVYAVKIVSNVSGAATSPNEPIDNYFGSSYNTSNIERLLTPTKINKVYSVLNSTIPFFDIALLMVNDQRYGGAGGSIATFSTHPDAVQIMVHEMGHTFSKLSDEYWVGDSYARESPNMTTNNNPGTIRWSSFLNQNGVGIFPHQESPSWYRPHQNCLMRFLGRPFCSVCENETLRIIDQVTKSEPLLSPVAFFGADKLEIYTNEKVRFFDLTSQEPESWAWTFEGGDPSSSTSKNPIVSYQEEGIYSVTLTSSNSVGSNSISRTQFIKVKKTDDIPPTLKVKNIEVELDESGKVQISASDVNNGTFDNVAIKALSISKSYFDCTDLGENPIFFKAIDVSGNSDSTEVLVNVLDRLSPIVRVKNLDIFLNEDGKASISPNDINDGSYDNCEIATYALSKDSFDIKDQGINNVELIVTDFSGNQSRGMAIVKVDILLSLDGNEKNGKITLFPNPSSGKVHISYLKTIDPGLYKIEIIDSKGTIVKEIVDFQKVNNEIFLDMEGLSSGTYLLRLKSLNGVEVIKFLINN